MLRLSTEIIPSLQQSDIQDAITFAQGLEQVDPSKIGIWGSSYAGGHCLQVGAADRRVKAVIANVSKKFLNRFSLKPS